MRGCVCGGGECLWHVGRDAAGAHAMWVGAIAGRHVWACRSGLKAVQDPRNRPSTLPPGWATSALRWPWVSGFPCCPAMPTRQPRSSPPLRVARAVLSAEGKRMDADVVYSGKAQYKDMEGEQGPGPGVLAPSCLRPACLPACAATDAKQRGPVTRSAVPCTLCCTVLLQARMVVMRAPRSWRTPARCAQQPHAVFRSKTPLAASLRRSSLPPRVGVAQCPPCRLRCCLLALLLLLCARSLCVQGGAAADPGYGGPAGRRRGAEG